VAVALDVQRATRCVGGPEAEALISAARRDGEHRARGIEAERLAVTGAEGVQRTHAGEGLREGVERFRCRRRRRPAVENPALRRARRGQASGAGLDLDGADRRGSQVKHPRTVDRLGPGDRSWALDHEHEPGRERDQQQERQQTPQRSPRAPADRHDDEAAQEDEPRQQHRDRGEQAARLCLGEDQR